jgi:hypothetical protein
MKKSIFLPVKKMAVVLTVILAGFLSTGFLHAQTGALITSFNFTLNPHYAENINHSAGTIVVPVYNSADITTLVATFTVSTGATVTVGGIPQTSGIGAKDYTLGVTFIVTSQDLSATKSYVVTVTRNAALTEKQLLTFSFEGVVGAVGVINQTDFTVEVTVPFSQSVTNLPATFTSSPVSKVYVGAALQTSGTTTNDFTSTVIYRVVAENTSVRNYYVTVTKAAARTEKQIITFEFRKLTPHVFGIINETAHTIALTVPHATDVTSLIAFFNHSPLSIVKIGSDVQKADTTENNFTNPVTYTVYAENGDTQNYVVTVTKAAASNAKDMLTFSFAGLVPPVTGIIVDQNITLTVPFGTDRTTLVATFTHSLLSTVAVGATPQVSGATQNDFTTDKVYVVTAENASTKNYTVHVAVVPPLTGKSILTFSFKTLDPDVIGTINESAKTITLTVPYATNVTSLIPTFTCSPKATVLVLDVPQKSDTTAQDFTNPVSYKCRSQEGSSEVYIVTVSKVPPSTANSILSFNFEIGFDPDVIGVINEGTKTITLTVPYSTNLTLPIKATFTSSPLSAVSIGAVPQVSGVTENSFSTTSDKFYTCTAEDLSFEIYTVKVIRAPQGTGNSILTFRFVEGFNPPIEGVITESITGNTIALVVPYSTVLTNLKATFTSSPYSTLSVNSVLQASGVTENNFTNPVVYTCTAEDLSTELYTVTVSKAAVQTGKAITEFRFNGLTPNVIGTINQISHTINLSVPFTTDVTNLVATFVASPMATVRIGLVVQASGVTPNNFSSNVIYSVTSENGPPAQDYTVIVTKIPLSTAKDITDLRFLGITIPPIIGVINEAANPKTISISVPYGTPLTALVATFTASPLATVKIGSTVQVSGTTINNFTNPLIYEVVAEDLSVKQYTVTVSIYEMPKRFLTYRFNSYTLIEGDTVRYLANGTINNDTRIVQVNIPASAQKTSLAASFTLTTNTTAWIGLVRQAPDTTLNNFTSPVIYTLSASDGSSLSNTVNVTNNPADTQKRITSFSFNGLSPAVNGAVDESAKTISAVLPYGTSRNGLVATYTTTSALTRVKIEGVIQKSGITANSFVNPVAYRCYDELGNFTEYMVTVTIAAGSSAKDITYFAFESFTPDVIGTINEVNRTITAVVPNGSSREALKANFTASPLSTVRVQGTIQQSGVTANDFRIPIIFEVTAQDGSFKNYTVSIGESPDTTKPVVSNTVQTVSNLTGQYVLIRSNEATGKLYLIKSNVDQTTIAHLEAAVAAGNGRSAYVTGANVDKAISTANLPDGTYYAYAIDAAMNKSLRGTNAIIVQDRIAPTVSVAAQTKTNALNNVVYVQSSESNSIVYLILEGIPQASKANLDAAVAANPKKGAKALVLSANSDVPIIVAGLVGGNYHAYAVDVSVYNNVSAPSTNVVVITEASRAKSILAFSFNQLDPPVIGQIIGTDISLTVKVGTPVTALVPTFTLSPLSTAYVGSIQQISGVTPNNFTTPIIYRVTAEDGSFLDYQVSVWFNTGIDQTELMNSIKSYPNPVGGRLTIESTRPLNRIIVINGLGQTMEDIRNPGKTTFEIPTGSWMKGIYFVRYYCEDQYIGIHKLIKD